MVFRGKSATASMDLIAAIYPPTANPEDALVPDFHTVRQALNVASADQRVLVLIHGTDQELSPVKKSLIPVANHSKNLGRFHYDFESSDEWKPTITGMKSKSGICLVRPGEFGLKGEVMAELPLTATADEIQAALTQANTDFASTTAKKVYSTHVSKGTREGIYFEAPVPYGEDRDGDGEIDHQGGGRRRSR